MTSTIGLNDIINYPPERLYEFECIEYEYIDNLHFILEPKSVLIDCEPYLEIAKQCFTKECWQGDGDIGLIWIPPFMLKEKHGETFYGDYGDYNEFTTVGIVLWHVKQQSDGISYLLFPKELASQFEFDNINTRTPILLEGIGKIYGRDAIYLDRMEFETVEKITLIGKFNGELCTESSIDEDIGYKITFNNVIDFSCIELDFYNEYGRYSASFEYYLHSKKIREFRKKDSNKCTAKHKHYVFYTYDRVFEIIAKSFDFRLKKH